MNSVPASILPKATKNHSAGGARAGTLIVCPVIALSQWKTEIEKFCEPGALSVCIYHGPNRSIDTSREAMRKYDVILTTYQVLEADMRKMVSPNKVRCPNCGRPFKLDKLRIHLKYFCGEGAERTEAQSRTHRNRDRDGRGAGAIADDLSGERVLSAGYLDGRRVRIPGLSVELHRRITGRELYR